MKHLTAARETKPYNLTPQDTDLVERYSRRLVSGRYRDCDTPEKLELLNKPIFVLKTLLETCDPRTPPLVLQAYRSLFDERTCPLRLFRPLGVNPEHLLSLLLFTNSFLAGSRALDYFVPGIADKDADWNFYCVGRHESFDLLVRGMVRLGFCVTQDPVYHKQGYLIELRGVIDGNPVTLYSDLSSLSPIECVTKFHSTILTCYVSATSAVCVQPLKAMHRISCVRDPGIVGTPEYEWCVKGVQKYTGRGIRYVSGNYYFLTIPVRRTGEMAHQVDMWIMPGTPTDISLIGKPMPYMLPPSDSSNELLEVVFDDRVWGTPSAALNYLRYNRQKISDLSWYERLTKRDLGNCHVSEHIGVDMARRGGEPTPLPDTVPEFMKEADPKEFRFELAQSYVPTARGIFALSHAQCDIRWDRSTPIDWQGAPMKSTAIACRKKCDGTPVPDDDTYDTYHSQLWQHYGCTCAMHGSNGLCKFLNMARS